MATNKYPVDDDENSYRHDDNDMSRPAPDREGELDVAQQEWNSMLDHLTDRLDVWEERGAVVYDLSDYLVDLKMRSTITTLRRQVETARKALEDMLAWADTPSEQASPSWIIGAIDRARAAINSLKTEG